MDPSKSAIRAALENDWKQAISLNLAILKQNPRDTDALNRLGRAYMETGQKSNAAKIYTKVLKLDKFNPIAKKSLELVKTMRVRRHAAACQKSSSPMFLEEPGLTKTINLTRLGDAKIISRLHAGNQVLIAAREHCVAITSLDNEYLGRLPDDLALRLRSFLKGGNRYDAWIRAIDLSDNSSVRYNVKIFIRETYRSSKFKNILSFPSTEKLTYAAFTPPNLIYDDRPVVSTPEEDLTDDPVSSNTDSDENDHSPPEPAE